MSKYVRGGGEWSGLLGRTEAEKELVVERTRRVRLGLDPDTGAPARRPKADGSLDELTLVEQLGRLRLYHNPALDRRRKGVRR